MLQTKLLEAVEGSRGKVAELENQLALGRRDHERQQEQHAQTVATMQQHIAVRVVSSLAFRAAFDRGMEFCFPLCGCRSTTLFVLYEE